MKHPNHHNQKNNSYACGVDNGVSNSIRCSRRSPLPWKPVRPRLKSLPGTVRFFSSPQLQILICLAALLIGLSLSAQAMSHTLRLRLPNSGPFPWTPDSTANLPLLGSSIWKSVKMASGNSAHLGHRHWHNEETALVLP